MIYDDASDVLSETAEATGIGGVMSRDPEASNFLAQVIPRTDHGAASTGFGSIMTIQRIIEEEEDMGVVRIFNNRPEINTLLGNQLDPTDGHTIRYAKTLLLRRASLNPQLARIRSL